MVMSLGVISLSVITLVALIWDQYDEVREKDVLIAAILISLLMCLWFISFMRIGKKIELIFVLFRLAGAAMRKNFRMLIYAVVVSGSFRELLIHC